MRSGRVVAPQDVGLAVAIVITATDRIPIHGHVSGADTLADRDAVHYIEMIGAGRIVSQQNVRAWDALSKVRIAVQETTPPPVESMDDTPPRITGTTTGK